MSARNISSIETSNRQFGFKKGLSCNHSIHTVNKVINDFNESGSTITICVIDLRKAFDKVNNYALFNVLQKNTVNQHLINILENWFGKSTTSVRFDYSVMPNKLI